METLMPALGMGRPQGIWCWSFPASWEQRCRWLQQWCASSFQGTSAASRDVAHGSTYSQSRTGSQLYLFCNWVRLQTYIDIHRKGRRGCVQGHSKDAGGGCASSRTCSRTSCGAGIAVQPVVALLMRLGPCEVLTKASVAAHFVRSSMRRHTDRHSRAGKNSRSPTLN